MKVRLKAIWFAVYHGFIPSFMYEETPHHNTTYLNHLWINIKYALRWASFREDADDVEFERETNKNY